MHSYIKKSSLIREFRMQVSGKTRGLAEQLDNAFFETINRVFRKKPYDVKFHITRENTLVFNMDFSGNVNVFMEHFPNQSPSTLMTISHGEEYGDDDRSEHEELLKCLEIIEDSLLTTEHDNNPTNP